jgi:peptidoglycan/xylan/chitin deacetylase (PgdA/CDA1 family)
VAQPNPVVRIVLIRTVQATLLSFALHWILHWPFTGPHAIGLFLTPLLCLSFVFTFVAPWTWGFPYVTRIPAHSPAVFLTFDDGPSAETTPAVLDALRDAGAYATFFVLGERVVQHPNLIQRILAEGHTIGIHAYHHRELVTVSPGTLRAELLETAAALRKIMPDADLQWFRPPYGFKTIGMPFQARNLGYRLVTWSVNSRDYHNSDPAHIARIVLSQAHPGAIILLHDGPANAATANALPLILAELADQDLKSDALREPPQEKSG